MDKIEYERRDKAIELWAYVGYGPDKIFHICADISKILNENIKTPNKNVINDVSTRLDEIDELLRDTRDVLNRYS